MLFVSWCSACTNARTQAQFLAISQCTFTRSNRCCCCDTRHIQRNISEIVLNRTEIRLYFLLFLFDLIKFRKDISVCSTHVTSKISTPRRFPSYLLLTLFLYFLFIFYFPRCTLPDFLSTSSHASLPFLSCCHRTTTLYPQRNRF